MSKTGLSHSRTTALDAISINANQSPSAFWKTIATSHQFQSLLTESVCECLTDVHYHDAVETLRDAGVTAGDGGLARLLADLALPPESLPDPDRRDAYWRALRVITQIGQRGMSPLGHLPLDAVENGPVAALKAADTALTIVVRVGQSFRERRRDQREDILELVSILGQTADIRIVCSGLMARWLASTHREQLPSEFIESCTIGGPSDSELSQLVDRARTQFDRDGREVNLLRELAEEPGESLSYHAVKSKHEVSASRISQMLNDLEQHRLVERWGPRTEQQVDLLPAGRELLNQINRETTRQQRLESLFSDAGQSSQSDVLARPHGRGSEDDTEQSGGTQAPYRTRYLGRAGHHSCAGTASDGEITLSEASPPTCETAVERKTRYVSYDSDRSEAVIAVRATTPLEYAVNLALGLASPRLLNKALPEDRFDNIDDPPEILRAARCIGALSDRALDDYQEFRSSIRSWVEDIEEESRKLNSRGVVNRDGVCISLLRSAHGLAGSLVHLFDVVDIKFVRELRIPSNLSSSQLKSVATTVAISTAIQSRYGSFASYRQLFEDRRQKRDDAFSPVVDYADPVGNMIGGLVVRSSIAERFGNTLKDRLSNPLQLHEDAPEFAVNVTVQSTGRPAYAETTVRMLKTKGIRPSPAAITLLRSLARSPSAVADALQRLGEEDQPREVRLDELRVALRHLESTRLLDGDIAPTAQKAVKALLTASTPLSRTELAERADVSTRSLRRHLGALRAIDLIRETGDGLRLAVPFRNSESQSRVLPDPVVDERRAVKTAKATTFEVVLARVTKTEARELGDPNTPLGRPFFGPPVRFSREVATLLEANPDLAPWVKLSQRLSDAPVSVADTVTFGIRSKQQSLNEATDTAHPTAN